MKPNGDETVDGENVALAGLPRYEAPAIEWEEPLEAVARFAAACEKFAVADTQCSMGDSSSS